MACKAELEFSEQGPSCDFQQPPFIAGLKVMLEQGMQLCFGKNNYAYRGYLDCFDLLGKTQYCTAYEDQSPEGTCKLHRGCLRTKSASKCASLEFMVNFSVSASLFMSVTKTTLY